MTEPTFRCRRLKSPSTPIITPQQGIAAGKSGTALTQYVQDAITTLGNKRRQEYNDLHKTYGKLGNTYNTSYKYNSATHLTFGPAAVNASANTFTLPTAIFTTGMGVMYHSGGGTIPGLVDGSIYYVVVDAADSTKFRLATDQLGTTIVDIGAPTGSANYFSEDGRYGAEGRLERQPVAQFGERDDSSSQRRSRRRFRPARTRILWGTMWRWWFRGKSARPRAKWLLTFR